MFWEEDFVDLRFGFIFDLICSCFSESFSECTFVELPRGVEVNLGRASFGSWDPLVRQKWRRIWKCCLAPQYIHPALQYLHKTAAQYMRSGVHTIFAHAPPSVYLQSYVEAGRGGGIWRESRARTSSNGFGSLLCPATAPLSFGRIWVDTLHLAPTSALQSSI